jgi:hypothetical protein
MSESRDSLPQDKEQKTVAVSRRKHPVRGKVYYEERRKRVAELRTIGNLTFEQIGERITAYGFAPCVQGLPAFHEGEREGPELRRAEE